VRGEGGTTSSFVATSEQRSRGRRAKAPRFDQWQSLRLPATRRATPT
jgi:hypothetical protein